MDFTQIIVQMVQNNLESSHEVPNPEKIFIEKLKNKRMEGNDYNKKSLHNACQQLSDKLYSTNWHFLYELIQNAEDNEYHDNSIPEVKFIFSSDKILIQNNEKGFTQEDIRNITDIGFSNKEKSDERHDIGENGIGFKSVFVLSDTPMIFSNGYHFQFDRMKELGYIMPEWISEIPLQIDRNITNILLPLNKNGKVLIKDINLIEPEMLLFLKKIKRIIIQDEISNNIKILEKNCQGNHIKLTTKSGDLSSDQIYFYVKKDFKRPPHILEEHRENIKTSQLELVFPLEEGSFKRGINGRVFSFMPINGYKGNIGFPFIIQGDFLLTSSRSEIYSTNEWNVWLKSKISDIFISAIQQFKQDEVLQYEFLNILPCRVSNKVSFFSEIVDEIDVFLKDTKCIMDVDKKWIKPGDAMYASSEIHEIIPNNILKKYLKYSFIDLNFIKKTEDPKIILERLDIAQFTVETLIKLLKYEDWYDVNLEKDWYAKLYAFLGNKIRYSKISLQDLDFLPIYYLEGKKLSTIKDEKIYLRPNDGLNRNIQTQVQYIDEYFYNNIHLGKDLETSISFLFKTVNIHPATAEIIIKNGIISIFYSTSWDQYDSKDKRDIIIFIKNNYKTLPKNIFDLLKSKIILRTESSLPEHHYKKPTLLYLSKKYNSKIDLESLIQDSPLKDTIFVSRDYIDHDNIDIQKDRSPDSWKQFFLEIGIKELYFPQEKECSYDNLPHSLENQISSELKIKFKNTIILDYDVPIPFNLFKNPLGILEYLASYWEKLNKIRNISKYNMNQITKEDTKRKQTVQKIKASWFYYLTTQQWIPSLTNQLLIPSEMYLPFEGLNDFIVGDVHLLNLNDVQFDFTRNPTFLKALGIHYQITVSMILKSIKDLKEARNHDFRKYERCYAYLSNHFYEDRRLISEFFSKGKYIFISNSKNPDLTPQFHKITEVIWSKESTSEIYHQFVISVQEDYPHLKNFFVKTLGIREKKNFDNYRKNFDEILQKTEALTSDERNFIYQYYKDINNQLKKNYSDLRKQPYWKDLKSKKFILTKRGQFWKNQNNIFYNNANYLFEVFESEEKIGFIDVKKEDIPLLNDFFEYYKIKSIDSQVTVNLIPDRKELEREDLTSLLKSAIPYILRFLYHKELSQYDKIIHDGRLPKLLSLKVIEVEELKVSITLSNIGEKYEKINKTSTMPKFFNKNQIYITKNNARHIDYISLLLFANFFKESIQTDEVPGIEDFIGNLLQKIELNTTITDLNAFLEDRKIYPISLDEQKNLEKFFDRAKLDVLLNEYSSINQKQEKIHQFKKITKKETPPTEENKKKKTLEQEIRKIGLRHYNLENLKQKIGLRGESIVFRKLVQKFSEKYPHYLRTINSECELELQQPNSGLQTISIQWKKSIQGKSNTGYDILVIENGNMTFIEVKSTKSPEKSTFPISESEWALAKKERENYLIYRVSNTLSDDPVVEIITNPYQRWLDGVIEAKPLELNLKPKFPSKPHKGSQSTKEKPIQDINTPKKPHNETKLLNIEKQPSRDPSVSNLNNENKLSKKKKKIQHHQQAKKHINQDKNFSKKFECSHCSAKFSLKRKLIKHSKKTGHAIPKKNVCVKCGYKFKFEDDLLRHIQEKHPLLQPKDKILSTSKFSDKNK